MVETEIEKAKRWLLGNYNELEILNIDLDLPELLKKYENQFNTIEVRDSIVRELKRHLESFVYTKQINDYLIEDNSTSDSKSFTVNIKPRMSVENIAVDIRII